MKNTCHSHRTVRVSVSYTHLDVYKRQLPVRGQRTKTNARTRKGPKRTVAGKKKATK